MFLTPVVTAFNKEGKLDAQANRNVWEHLIKGGIDGIVIM
ncbi:dihydrodipicolinate synthase family protein, partial [Peptostreptococcus porci]